VFTTRTRRIDSLTVEKAVHGSRVSRERPPSFRLLPPTLINTNGAFIRQYIKRRTLVLARDLDGLLTPNASTGAAAWTGG
jgi:hypothetical protein